MRGRVSGRPVVVVVAAILILCTAVMSGSWGRASAQSGSSVFITSSSNPSVIGQTVNFEAQLSGVADSVVRFTLSGSTPVDVQSIGGVATLSTVPVGTGSHTLVAEVLSSPGLSGTVVQDVDKGRTVMGLAASSDTSSVGETATFTTTLYPVGPARFQDGGFSGGKVTFYIDGAEYRTVDTFNETASILVDDLSAGPHDIYANFSGSLYYEASAAATIVHTVGKAASTVSVTADPETPTPADPVTLRAVVGAGSGVANGGTVTFFVDGFGYSPVPVTGGQASLSIGTLDLGEHQVMATFSGSDDHEGSSSDVAFLVVGRYATDLTLSSSANPSHVGDEVTFFVSVNGSEGRVPTGNVVLTVDGVEATRALANGAATFMASSLTLGDHSVSARYEGSAVFEPHPGQSLTQSVLPVLIDTSTAVTTTPNPSEVGEPVTVTATVIADQGGIPDGSMDFLIDGTSAGALTLAGGTASLTLPSLAAGNHSLRVVYQGTDVFGSSTSAGLTLQVGPVAAPTTTVLAASPNSSKPGDTVAFTATVGATAATPDGSVVFAVDGVDRPPVTLVNGMATLSVDGLQAGDHQVTASYAGNATFAPSASVPLGHTVNKHTTDTSLESTGGTGVLNSTITFIASVNAQTGGVAAGTVVFTIDNAETLVPVVNGTATLSTSTLGVGVHMIVASYGGSDAHEGSTSQSLTYTVNPNFFATFTSVSSSPNPSLPGQEITLTASVSAPSVSQVPEGAIGFTVDGISRGSVATVGGGASITIAGLGPGPHTVEAGYGGEADFAPSSSDVLIHEVSEPLAATFTTLSSSVSPSAVGQSVTFTATVASDNGSPPGFVVFIVDGSDLPAAALTSGTATLTIDSLAIGTHTIGARYGGGESFAESTAAPIGQVVEDAKLPSTTRLESLSGTEGPPGVAASFRATVTGTAVMPTGTVTFIVDGVGLPIELAGGVATFTTEPLADGTHTIDAVYQGDERYDPSEGSQLTYFARVKVYDTSTVLTVSPNPATFGEPLLFTATVTAPDYGQPVTGRMILRIDGQDATDASVENGVASFTMINLPAGSHTASAYYEGTEEVRAGASSIVDLVVNPANVVTTIALSSSANPADSGFPLTITASVQAVQGIPGGEVIFTVDGVDQVPVALSNGTASLVLIGLSGGSHVIGGRYAGNDGFAVSIASPLSQVVTVPRPTTTTLVSSKTPIGVGEAVTFTATVGDGQGGVPEGSVVFQIDGLAQPAVTLANGVASLTTAALTAGDHEISAFYGGSSAHGTSTATPIVQEVRAESPTTMTLVSSKTPIGVGEAVTFTATVDDGQGGVPEGSVVFQIDRVAQPAIPLANGVANLTIAALVAGDHEISAAYGGSPAHGASEAQAIVQQVRPESPTTVTLTSSKASARAGEAVTFTATVGDGQGGVPEGSVVFQIDGVAQPAVPLANGVASLTTAALAAGRHEITATYAGSQAHGASEVATLSQTVGLSVTSVALSSSAAQTPQGQAVTFTAVVSSAVGTPEGTVAFSVDGSALATVALAGGRANVETSTLPVGNHTVVAVYSGSAVDEPATSPSLQQTIGPHPDSEKLDKLQRQITQRVAQASGQAISGAIDQAVSDGLSNSAPIFAAGDGSVRINYLAVPPSSPAPAGSALDGLVAGDSTPLRLRARKAADGLLGYAEDLPSPDVAVVGVDPRRWQLWTEIRHTQLNTDTATQDLDGRQINVLTGIGYRLTETLLIGAFGGYENFDYNSQALSGWMDGDGWTGGFYLGWKIAPALRFDAGIAGSAVSYDAQAGLATADFDGSRFLLQSGLTGSHAFEWFDIEPSARIYALWETDDGYTDSLGGPHAARSWSTARASGGIKVRYPIAAGEGLVVSPYAGIYADYTFTGNDEPDGISPDAFIADGLSARLLGGLTFDTGAGTRMSLGAEFGGLGQDEKSTTVHGRLQVRF